MCRNTNIIIRVSEKEKEKANDLVEFFNEKNISSLLRNYINDFYELVFNTPISDVDLIIKELEEELQGKCSAMQRQRKEIDLKLLKRVKREYLEVNQVE